MRISWRQQQEQRAADLPADELGDDDYRVAGAPGLHRRFAFERLLPFASALRRAELQRLRSHASARIRPHAEVPIVASDVSFRRVD